MYDWIYDHVINTTFFIFFMIGVPLIILGVLMYPVIKEEFNK